MSVTPDSILADVDDAPTMMGAMATLSALGHGLVVDDGTIEVDGLVRLQWSALINAWLADWIEP